MLKAPASKFFGVFEVLSYRYSKEDRYRNAQNNSNPKRSDSQGVESYKPNGN